MLHLKIRRDTVSSTAMIHHIDSRSSSEEFPSSTKLYKISFGQLTSWPRSHSLFPVMHPWCKSSYSAHGETPGFASSHAATLHLWPPSLPEVENCWEDIPYQFLPPLCHQFTIYSGMKQPPLLNYVIAPCNVLVL